MQMPLRIAGSQKEKQYRSLNFCNCSTTVLHHAFVFSLQLYYKRISVCPSVVICRNRREAINTRKKFESCAFCNQIYCQFRRFPWRFRK